MTVDIKILKANESDLPEILALQKLCYQENVARYNDNNIPPMIETVDDLLKDAQTHIFLKALNDDKVIGSARGYNKPEYCYIGRVMVHPDYQNQGIGRKLILALENELGGSVFELTAGHLDEKNIALYQKLGYKAYGEKEKVTDTLYFIHMRKNKTE